MARIVAVIPARMGSTRFPDKPLARILGRPMIEHVLRRALMCPLLEDVYVATCDDEIRASVEASGGKVVMTSASHERASERAAEAARHFEADIVVMIQGDEPMITPSMVEAAVAPLLSDESVSCVNLARRITSREEYLDPNTIKVATDARGDALYFSRSPVPANAFAREGGGADSHARDVRPPVFDFQTPVFKQVCVIPFRRALLEEFARLAPTPLERAESIDMLRLLGHGVKVRMVETDADTHAVDTPEDLRRVEALMKGDPLVALYGGAFGGTKARRPHEEGEAL